MERNKIYHGNNLDILRTFEDNSIDSIVTDPPYGLGKEPNALEVLQSWITTGYHEIKGKGFMGKEWDSFVPQPVFWKECLRVLKPGGHLLSFAGTRTYDWVVMGLRIAGFEIRDLIAWVYSSGFPKALDIEKELKKMLIKFVNSGIMGVGDNNENRNERKISDEQKTEHNLRPMWQEYLQKTEFDEEKFREILQSFMSEQGLQISRNSTCDVWGEQPSMEGRSDDEEKQGELQGCEICSMSERIYRDVKERWIYNGTSFSDGKTFESDIEKVGSDTPHRPRSEQQRDKEFDTLFIKWRTQKIRSITEKIKEISGWKTALKPALEPIVMARKPLDGTVAGNVLKHGVGGINIDGCRVATDDFNGKTFTMPKADNSVSERSYGISGGMNREKPAERVEYEQNQNGRFPANFIHDGSEEVLKLFPNTEAGGSITKTYEDNAPLYGDYKFKEPFESYADSGSAARFFYTPKASQNERNFGLSGFEDDVTTDGRTKPIDNAFNRGETKRKNIHPTVKPIDLMQYLVRLVTPKGGLCLDPFMGSGTTAIACKSEKIDYIGCELDGDYIKIAESRIKSEVVMYDIFDFMD